MNPYDNTDLQCQISFECPNCREQISENVSVPSSDWSGASGDPKLVDGDAFIACADCEHEYEVNLSNQGGKVWARLVIHPHTEVIASEVFIVEQFDDYVDFLDIPQSPSDNLIDTLRDVSEVIKIRGTELYLTTVRRMAFIQQFAALEAYLADTLTKEVINRHLILVRSVKKIDDLRDMKLTLAQIVDNPEIVKISVMKYLQGLVYHNFGKVDTIWKSVLGFSIFPDNGVRTRLSRAVPVRHDCVHRNGKDKEGKIRTELDATYLRQMENDIYAVMNHIEMIIDPDYYGIPF